MEMGIGLVEDILGLIITETKHFFIIPHNCHHYGPGYRISRRYFRNNPLIFTETNTLYHSIQLSPLWTWI